MFIIYFISYNINGDYMKIRLGYACISKTLDVTTSSTYTYTNFSKELNYDKLDKIIISNLEDFEKIIDYNIKNNIHFFRMSSNMIPLATKVDVVFDYLEKYKDYYERIGNKINKNNLRVDFHPGEFCVLNSTRKEVVTNSINILKYHYNLLKYLNIKDKVLVLHIGSSVLGIENSIKRFINNFNKLPNYLKECIVIENDDKIFNINDCLYISSKLNIPIVLDYHHYICNNNSNLYDYIEDIFNTWKKQPKIHFSSPKNKTKKDFRSHNDYIDSDEFIKFLENIKKLNYDIDIMIEAKAKDEALFRLVRELKYKTDYKFIDETTFLIY